MRLSLKVLRTSSPGVLLCVLLVRGEELAPWAGILWAALCVWAAALWHLRGLREVRRLVDGLVAGQQREQLPEGLDEIGRLAAGIHAVAQKMERREHRIEEQLKQQGAILASMSEGILALDGGRRVLMANKAAAQLLGVPEPLAAGRALSEITRIPAILQAVDSCLMHGKRVQDEGRVAGVEPERLLHITASPREPDGDVQRLCVLVLRDVTALRQLEQVRRDFVANVSHELKTPLTSVQAFLEAVLEDPDMDAGQRERFLGKVQRNTERITAIVSDLLDLARLEGSAELRKERLDLGALAASCVERCREDAADGGVSLQLDRAPGELPLLGDQQELAGAVGNLLENAIKYTPEGGHVRVRTGADDETLWISVEDDGPGIAAHEIERIFERFYRVDKDRSRALGGTGLGLSIVRNVARQHRGRVSVKSKPGAGSTFRLELPRAPVAD